MIANQQELNALMHNLADAAWSLAALGALFESGLIDELDQPRSIDEIAARKPAWSRDRIRACLGVLEAHEVVLADQGRYRLAEGVGCFRQGPMRASVAAQIRMNLSQAAHFLDDCTNPAPMLGWQHTDPAILQSQGDASAMFAPALKMMIGAQLDGLLERLDQPNAKFLDVGVGVGALAVAMCRVFPQVSVVGLDVADAPLALARQRVAGAQLEGRIELRKQPAHELPDDAAFDLAWFPIFFIADSTVPESFRRLHASLRPGGWALVPLMGALGDPKHRAVGTLIGHLWGGPTTTPDAVEGQLREAGFAEFRRIPGPMLLIAARR